MGITIQEVGIACFDPIDSVLIAGTGEGTYVQGNTNGFIFLFNQYSSGKVINMLRKFASSDRDYMVDSRPIP